MGRRHYQWSHIPEQSQAALQTKGQCEYHKVCKWNMKLITTSIKRWTHQGSVVKKKTLKNKSLENKWEMKGEQIYI